MVDFASMILGAAATGFVLWIAQQHYEPSYPGLDAGTEEAIDSAVHQYKRRAERLNKIKQIKLRKQLNAHTRLTEETPADRMRQAVKQLREDD